MRLKFIFYRYEVILTIIALLIIGSVSNISKTISVEPPVQAINDFLYPVALTFDDGPYTGFTEKLLSILNIYGAKATFFVIGRHVKSNPSLIRQIDFFGHELGSHTYNHSNITKLSNKNIIDELQKTKNYIQAITGKQIYLFRPPGGNYNSKSMEIISHLGYTTVLWTILPKDTEECVKKEDIIRCIKEDTRPYSIILLHMGRQETIDALPEIILYLKSKGYRFVTLSELLNKNGQTVRQHIIPKHGESY